MGNDATIPVSRKGEVKIPENAACENCQYWTSFVNSEYGYCVKMGGSDNRPEYTTTLAYATGYDGVGLDVCTHKSFLCIMYRSCE